MNLLIDMTLTNVLEGKSVSVNVGVMFSTGWKSVVCLPNNNHLYCWGQELYALLSVLCNVMFIPIAL